MKRTITPLSNHFKIINTGEYPDNLMRYVFAGKEENITYYTEGLEEFFKLYDEKYQSRKFRNNDIMIVRMYFRDHLTIGTICKEMNIISRQTVENIILRVCREITDVISFTELVLTGSIRKSEDIPEDEIGSVGIFNLGLSPYTTGWIHSYFYKNNSDDKKITLNDVTKLSIQDLLMVEGGGKKSQADLLSLLSNYKLSLKPCSDEKDFDCKRMCPVYNVCILSREIYKHPVKEPSRSVIFENGKVVVRIYYGEDK